MDQTEKDLNSSIPDKEKTSSVQSSTLNLTAGGIIAEKSSPPDNIFLDSLAPAPRISILDV